MPGGLVADVMGLGKTFMSVAAAMMCKLLTKQVVMGLPLSMLWVNGIEQWVNTAQNASLGLSVKDGSKTPYASIQPYRNMVAHVDLSDYIWSHVDWLVRLLLKICTSWGAAYREWQISGPRSCAATTLSLSFCTDLLGCKCQHNEKEWKWMTGSNQSMFDIHNCKNP